MQVQNTIQPNTHIYCMDDMDWNCYKININLSWGFIFQKSEFLNIDSKHYNKEVVVPMWSGNFFSYKVSPSTAAPHLSVTPKESDGDFGNLRTSSCAFPALPQKLFYIVPMPWLILFQAPNLVHCIFWKQTHI